MTQQSHRQSSPGGYNPEALYQENNEENEQEDPNRQYLSDMQEVP